eukprot:455065_1
MALDEDEYVEFLSGKSDYGIRNLNIYTNKRQWNFNSNSEDEKANEFQLDIPDNRLFAGFHGVLAYQYVCRLGVCTAVNASVIEVDHPDYQSVARDPCFHDIKFIVGDPEDPSKEFGANRGYLSSKSDVFKAMLYGRMFEGSPDAVVYVPDIKPDIFEKMLRFIYTGKISCTATKYGSMLYALTKYQIDDHEEAMDILLNDLLTTKTACVLLNACRNGFDKAVSCIVGFINTNRFEIFCQENYFKDP